MTRLYPLILLILALYASPNFIVKGVGLETGCQNAPTPRIHAGMRVVVAAGIDRLNLRSLPAVSTGIQVQLYAGNQLTVISGPSCNGHFNWWRVENVNGRRGWVAESTWQMAYILPVNRPVVDPVAWSCPSRFNFRACVLP